jgi:hypothetical protein
MALASARLRYISMCSVFSDDGLPPRASPVARSTTTMSSAVIVE